VTFEFRVVVATVVAVPWPGETYIRAVTARHSRPPYSRSILPIALDQRAEETAALARRTLARRWPAAEAVVVDKTPVEGILHEAGRFRADVIAVGWRGHGIARRLLMSSVSRGVVRGAKCAVLVVRKRPRRVRRIVTGFDASKNAQRAVELVARLVSPSDGRASHCYGTPDAELAWACDRWHSLDDCP
jgi:nucleotide-binding universal stress UspA family protein